MKTPTFLLFLLLLPLAAARAQTRGCTDPRATNYSAAATSNDGSCQYPTTTTALATKAPLDAAVPESSGLQYTSQGLWTFNDSGHAPVLFKVDSTTGNVVQQVTISNFGNVDWEDVAADAQYLYVGDIGNNAGSRTDLRVLRVLKSAIGTAPTTSVTAQAIYFSYPDQTNFNPGTNNHNFDCEAFFYSNDSLHLFTKNWADLRTSYYTIPAQPGTHVAHLKGRFNTNGLITAADLNPAGTGAGLLGYNASTGATFLWLLSDFRNGQFLQGNKRRIELPNAFLMGQAEGLTFVDRYRVFISNERLTNIITIPQRLYALNTSAWLAPGVPTATAPALSAGFIIAPNPARQTIHVARGAGPAEALTLVLLDMRGRAVHTSQMAAGSATHSLDVSQVAAGLYVLKINSSSGSFSSKVEIP